MSNSPVYTDEQIAEARRNRKLSACVGKEPFESRKVAENVARRRRGQSKDAQAYKCAGCGKYHIGGATR